MSESELGRKLVEIRNSKGLTQESLAEKTNISVRTIQRIENGEVKPRVFTLKILSEALGYDFINFNKKNSNDSVYIIILHLSNFIPIVVIPLIIWMMEKDSSETIYETGRKVINYQIILFIINILFFFISISTAGSLAIDNIENHIRFLITYQLIFVGLNALFSITNLIWNLAGKKIIYPGFNIVR